MIDVKNDLNALTITEQMSAFVKGFIEAAECLCSDTNPTTGETVEDARGYEWDVQGKAEITIQALSVFLDVQPYIAQCPAYSFDQAGTDAWLDAVGAGVGVMDRVDEGLLPEATATVLADRADKLKVEAVSFTDDGLLTI